ncbi:hypothetical protein HNR77_000123 [Paenibacillus sp. JGP012]|nr:hypothetical protein [Paenibacillus sp. JGP012]
MMNEYVRVITDEISDYREGEIAIIDEEHVERWLWQFTSTDRLIIAREMAHIVSNFYLTKSETKTIIKTILQEKELFGDLKNAPQKTKFLNIQQNGRSQIELLDLVNEILVEDYNTSLDDLGSTPNRYIYFDDCLFSGKRLFTDIRHWVEENKELDVELQIIYIACYSRNYFSTKKRIEELTKDTQIKVKYFEWVEFYNYHKETLQKYECCWAGEPGTHNEDLQNYIAELHRQCESKNRGPRLFRGESIGFEETIFTSLEGRNVVEQAFLEHGSAIVRLSRNNNLLMRPLGFESYESLGFGAMFITYRNIANNCPLVLWWGDTTYPPSHPFSKWHPLFPRRINN